jgi:glutaredoxin-like protein NrdH
MEMTHVPGKNLGKISVYALSTCPWCKKAKQFLNDRGIEYEFTDVDLLQGADKSSAITSIEKWNPACSFPTIVIDEKQCIVGYDEEKLKEALKL